MSDFWRVIIIKGFKNTDSVCLDKVIDNSS